MKSPIGFVEAGGLVSITLEEQVLAERLALISRIAQSPLETNVFRARLFWFGDVRWPPASAIR